MRLALDPIPSEGFAPEGGRGIDDRADPGRGNARARPDGSVEHAPAALELAVVVGERSRRIDAVQDAVLAAYDEHAERLHGFTVAAVRDPDVARDIVQEAFVRLTSQLRTGRPPDNVAAWLFRVAANLAISRGRHESARIRALPRIEDRRSPATPEETAIEREESRAMAAALQDLRPDARVALLLGATGMSAEEVGRAIGRTANATRALVCRSRQELRTVLASREAGR